MHFSELENMQRRYAAMTTEERKKFVDAHYPPSMQTDVVSITFGNTIVTIIPNEEYKVVDICYSSTDR